MSPWGWWSYCVVRGSSHLDGREEGHAKASDSKAFSGVRIPCQEKQGTWNTKHCSGCVSLIRFSHTPNVSEHAFTNSWRWSFTMTYLGCLVRHGRSSSEVQGLRGTCHRCSPAMVAPGRGDQPVPMPDRFPRMVEAHSFAWYFVVSSHWKFKVYGIRDWWIMSCVKHLLSHFCTLALGSR